MKIAVLSSGLGHVARGVEAWADDLASELNRRGLEVILFKGGGRRICPFERVIRCARRDHGTARFLKKISPRFGWRYGFGSAYQIEQTTFAWQVVFRLWLGRFDIAHTQDPWLALILERTRAFHKAKVILAHGTEEPFTFLLNFCHVQELVPRYLEEDRKKGLPSGRAWFAIPNFVDCEVFSPGGRDLARRKFGIPEDKVVVLDVAALKFSHKRLDYLVKEAAFLRRGFPQVFVVICGASTPETSELRKFASSVLGDNHLILADMDKKDMPDLYRAAEIFAHPACFEMMPVALLEAMASGLAVVTGTDPTYAWVAGPAGTPADMEKPGGLAQALGPLIEAPELIKQRGNMARLRVSSMFSKDRIVTDIIEMYKTVLAGR